MLVDNRVRGNAVRVSQTGIGDWFAYKFTLGPKGSIWGCTATFAIAPDGGIFQVQLASIASPNPNRAGFEDWGTLSDDTPGPWISILNVDTYNPVFADDYWNGFQAYRFMGEDGDPLTDFVRDPFGNAVFDPYTGYEEVDGGAGVYFIRCIVTGQNGASAGTKCRLTGLYMLRIGDDGLV